MATLSKAPAKDPAKPPFRTSRETFDWEASMRPFMNEWYSRTIGIPDRSCACMSYDLKVNRHKLEEKFLFCRPLEQMLVEMMQDIETCNLGWFAHVTAEILVWAHCPPDHKSPPTDIFWIDYPRFKLEVIKDYKTGKEWRTEEICTLGWGTAINHPMTWQPLFDAGIVRKYTLADKPRFYR